jgi:hypothetical protein
MKKAWIMAMALFVAGGFVGAQTPEKEVYIGIISFDQQARDLTGGQPVLLNKAGLDRLLGIIKNNYQLATVPGTTLYYAVHQALTSLTTNESQFPNNLGTVSIVTFTDGLDNGSTSPQLKTLEGRSFGGTRPSEYPNFLKEQLASGFSGRKIRGLDITAFSVGVMGNDIDPANEDAFRESIKAVSSSGNDFKIGDFAELEAIFQQIADSLYTKTIDITFEAVTPTYASGTKVRMTFDVQRGNNASSSAESSRKYLEGEVAYNNGQYQLINVSYGGDINSMILRGGSVNGSLDGVVTYVFPSLLGYNPETDPKPRQWSMPEGSRVWQVNSEYDANDDPTTKEESHPAVIYLVLDCSTSLARDSVEQIRTAVERFLQIMYSGDTSQPVPVPRTTTASTPLAPAPEPTPAAAPAPRPAYKPSPVSENWFDKRFYLGARGGLSIGMYEPAGYMGEANVTFSGDTQFDFAVQASLQFSKFVGIQAEMIFTGDPITASMPDYYDSDYSYGYGEWKSTPDTTITSSSLMIPLLLKITVGFGDIFASQFFAGPYFSIPLGKLEQSESGYKNSFDFVPSPGIMFGSSFGMKLGPGLFFIDARFAIDIKTTVIESEYGSGSSEDLYSRSKFLFSVGYELGFGG